MAQKLPSNEYIKLLTEASNTVWKIFKTACVTKQDPSRVFQQVSDKYTGTPASRYVNAYLGICNRELKTGKTSAEYAKEALAATGNMWKLFKEFFGKVYEGTMTETDWSLVAKSSAIIGSKYSGTPIQTYAEYYSILCTHELDKIDRELRGISDEMTLQEYMVRR